MNHDVADIGAIDEAGASRTDESPPALADECVPRSSSCSASSVGCDADLADASTRNARQVAADQLLAVQRLIVLITRAEVASRGCAVTDAKRQLRTRTGRGSAAIDLIDRRDGRRVQGCVVPATARRTARAAIVAVINRAPSRISSAQRRQRTSEQDGSAERGHDREACGRARGTDDRHVS